MGVIDDFSVVKRFVCWEDQLEGTETSSDPGMVQENVPGVGSHGGALSAGDFERLEGRKALDELLYTQPRHHEKSKQEHGTPGKQMLSDGAAENQPENQDTDFHRETHKTASRGGEKQSADGHYGKKADKKPAFPAYFAKG